MGSTRKAIRVGMLFGGMALSLASLPALLTKIDSVRNGASLGGGITDAPADAGALLGEHAGRLGVPAAAAAPDPRELLESRRSGAEPPKPVTRVLGPDD
ncbi:MAG: hypothetical protein AAGH64_03150 [Planctomycetota bacterium]